MKVMNNWPITQSISKAAFALMSTDTSQLKWIWKTFAALLAIIFLYIGSIGPVYSLVMRSAIPVQPVLTFYSPIPSRAKVQILELWTHVDPKVALALNGEW